jgi:hypothetical protein
VLEGLVTTQKIDVPKAMVANETQRLRENMMRQFGGNAKNINPSMLPDELFALSRPSVPLPSVCWWAKSSSRLQLKVDGDRVRTLIDEIAESYETPADVVNWYYGNKEQTAARLSPWCWRIRWLTTCCPSRKCLTRPAAMKMSCVPSRADCRLHSDSDGFGRQNTVSGLDHSATLSDTH